MRRSGSLAAAAYGLRLLHVNPGSSRRVTRQASWKYTLRLRVHVADDERREVRVAREPLDEVGERDDLPLAHDTVLEAPVEVGRGEGHEPGRCLDERTDRAPVLAGLFARQPLDLGPPERPARGDDVAEGIALDGAGGQHSRLVPAVAGAERPLVAQSVEQHARLVEPVAADDDLLETDQVGAQPLDLGADERHPGRERLGDVPAVERQYPEGHRPFACRTRRR